MASDVHTGITPNVSQGRGGRGGSSRSTANLVRLLREAEEGKGLEIDYSAALCEALGQKNDFGDDVPRAIVQQQKGARRSLALLGRVPSIGRKRCGSIESCCEAHTALLIFPCVLDCCTAATYIHNCIGVYIHTAVVQYLNVCSIYIDTSS